jgi:hypothetical protein
VKSACGAEAAGGGPSPGGRIVQFRAREIGAETTSSCDEHLAVGQQRRRVTIACGAEAAGIIKSKRGIAGQSRHRRRSQKKRVRDPVLLGGGSLRKRKWNHANGDKQKQVKGASKKMRFVVWISLLFHFDLIGIFLPFIILIRKLRGEVSKIVEFMSIIRRGR